MYFVYVFFSFYLLQCTFQNAFVSFGVLCVVCFRFSICRHESEKRKPYKLNFDGSSVVMMRWTEQTKTHRAVNSDLTVSVCMCYFFFGENSKSCQCNMTKRACELVNWIRIYSRCDINNENGKGTINTPVHAIAFWQKKPTFVHLDFYAEIYCMLLSIRDNRMLGSKSSQGLNSNDSGWQQQQQHQPPPFQVLWQRETKIQMANKWMATTNPSEWK